MLFFQTLSACAGATIYGDDRIRIRATWETPFSKEPKEQVIDTTLNALAGDDDELTKAAAIAGYAEALLQIAEATPNTDRAAVIDEALAAANAAKNAATDPDLICRPGRGLSGDRIAVRVRGESRHVAGRKETVTRRRLTRWVPALEGRGR
jgi:hypothetical protein